MISQPLTIIRTNKLGKPYVQNADPSTNNHLSVNDMWLNPSEGTFKTWNGTEWEEMQWGASAIMDDCIANRMIANDISASKITTGILQSQNGDFLLDLTTGEAQLLNLIMGGQVEGNIIATSYNGRTRVRLRDEMVIETLRLVLSLSKRKMPKMQSGKMPDRFTLPITLRIHTPLSIILKLVATTTEDLRWVITPEVLTALCGECCQLTG